MGPTLGIYLLKLFTRHPTWQLSIRTAKDDGTMLMLRLYEPPSGAPYSKPARSLDRLITEEQTQSFKPGEDAFIKAELSSMERDFAEAQQ